MVKGITKTIGLFLLLLFVSGAVLIPAYHKAHCEEHLTAGDTHCSICQVASTACITPLSSHVIGIDQRVVSYRQVACPMFVAASLRSLSQARAPPAG
jgi:hypothetical protein